jgi:hypothetical protein
VTAFFLPHLQYCHFGNGIPCNGTFDRFEMGDSCTFLHALMHALNHENCGKGKGTEREWNRESFRQLPGLTESDILFFLLVRNVADSTAHKIPEDDVPTVYKKECEENRYNVLQ